MNSQKSLDLLIAVIFFKVCVCVNSQSGHCFSSLVRPSLPFPPGSLCPSLADLAPRSRSHGFAPAMVFPGTWLSLTSACCPFHRLFSRLGKSRERGGEAVYFLPLPTTHSSSNAVRYSFLQHEEPDLSPVSFLLLQHYWIFGFVFFSGF